MSVMKCWAGPGQQLLRLPRQSTTQPHDMMGHSDSFNSMYTTCFNKNIRCFVLVFLFSLTLTLSFGLSEIMLVPGAHYIAVWKLIVIKITNNML